MIGIKGSLPGTLSQLLRKLFTLVPRATKQRAPDHTQTVPAPAQRTPEEIEVDGLRQQVHRARRYSRIFEVTSADYLDGYKVERLGALTVQAKSRTKADRALKDAALNKHPDVNALLDLVCETQVKELTSGTDVGGSAKTKRKTIKIWTATACQAIALERVGEPPRLWRQDIAIVDGSNVMHWDSGQPNLKPLRDVIDLLQKKGREPYVVFDRGAGYKLQGKHLTSTKLGEELGRQVQIELAPKFEPADHRILDLAEQLLAPIVSNDHFRDRPEARDIPKIKGFSKHGVTEILKPLP